MYSPAAATCFERLGSQERVRATAPVENDAIKDSAILMLPGE
jgi:hypothetical protein